MSKPREVFEVQFTFDPTSDRWTATLPSGQRTSFPRTRGQLPPFLEQAMNAWRAGVEGWGEYDPPDETSRERAVRLQSLGKDLPSTSVFTTTPGLAKRVAPQLRLSLEDLELEDLDL